MPFLRRFQQIMQKYPEPPVEKKLYWQSHIVAAIFLLLISVVMYFQRDKYTLSIFNQSVAWTSVILIGLSFALSGICYFWDFADTKIIYRKHLGVVGYHYGIIHFLLTIYIIAQRSNIFEYFASDELFWPFLLGVLALMYFAFMTMISSQYLVHELGSHRWRVLLRIGYVAFFLVVLHYGIQSWPYWVRWWEKKTFPPSISLVIFVFSILVFVLRLALEIHVRSKKKEHVESSTTLQPISDSN